MQCQPLCCHHILLHNCTNSLWAHTLNERHWSAKPSAVIVLVCWLESITVSWLSHVCHAYYFGPAYAKFAHEFLTLFHRFSFPSWFHTIWFYCSHTFHSFLSQITLCFSFGSKDMITVFTCLPSYSFTLWACLCWRHTYCQWPIIELAMNVSPKNKTAASHVVQIYTHVCFPRSKKWPTYT